MEQSVRKRLSGQTLIPLWTVLLSLCCSEMAWSQIGMTNEMLACNEDWVVIRWWWRCLIKLQGFFEACQGEDYCLCLSEMVSSLSAGFIMLFSLRAVRHRLLGWTETDTDNLKFGTCRRICVKHDESNDQWFCCDVSLIKFHILPLELLWLNNETSLRCLRPALHHCLQECELGKRIDCRGFEGIISHGMCFSPSSGFSALDSQPSGRVFYRSHRAHRLTAHDLQHWMMNGKKSSSHPSRTQPLHCLLSFRLKRHERAHWRLQHTGSLE